MKRSRLRRGTTLVEALVVLGIFSLIMGILGTLIYYSMRWRDVTSGKQGAIQDLAFFSQRLKRQLRQTTFYGVSAHYPSGTPATGDLILGFPQARDNTGRSQQDPGTGDPLFQSYLVYYRSGNQILQTETPLAPPSVTAPALPAAQLLAATSGQGKKQISEVERFLLVDDNDNPKGHVSRRVRFRVEVSVDSKNRAPARSVTQDVTFLF